VTALGLIAIGLQKCHMTTFNITSCKHGDGATFKVRPEIFHIGGHYAHKYVVELYNY